MRLVALLSAAALAATLAGCKEDGGTTANTTPKPPPGKNTFVGTVKAEWLKPEKPADYYRDMRLLEPFTYIDTEGQEWSVPAGSITDGASIPWGFWNIVGGPFDGPYREAAVVHDYFCDKKVRTWEATHRMFYDAMLARGISENLARTMYAGVRYGGPRWDPPAAPAPAPAPSPAAPEKSGFINLPGLTSTPAYAGATPPAPEPAPAVKPDPAVAPAPAPAAAADAEAVPAAGPQRPIQDPDVPAPPVRSIGRSIGANKELRTFDDIRQWIERENPSLEEIDKRVEEMRRLEGKPADTP